MDVWGPRHPYDVADPFYGRVDAGKLAEHPSFSEKYENKPSNYAYSKQFWHCMDGMDWTQMNQVLARSYEHAMMVDDALGRVVKKLEDLSLSENTLIILTADHGDIVSAHGGLFNKETLMVEETMKIPLVMRWDNLSPAKRYAEILRRIWICRLLSWPRQTLSRNTRWMVSICSADSRVNI